MGYVSRYFVAKITEVALSAAHFTNAMKGRLAIAEPIVKVNLGAGLAVAPGWVNVDGSFNALLANFPSIFHGIAYRLSGANRYYTKEEYLNILGKHRFVFFNLAVGVPFRENSVDYMFTSHFLEHLRLSEARRLLKESFKALKPGGLFRITVPDLEYALSLYPSAKEEMLERFFFVDDDSNDLSRHKYMYDFVLLKKMLEDIGFTKVKRLTFKAGECPDLNLLDNRPDESLFVECHKPQTSAAR